MKVYSDPATASYNAPGHPEAPFRVLRSAERLAAAGLATIKPELPADDSSLLLAHSPEHLSRVKNGRIDDPDTPALVGIEALARISAAGALAAMRSAVSGEPSFSLMRPPGHHSGRDRAAGFCYYNGLATATLSAIKDHKIARVAILDFDVHHGDGTQNIVLGRPDVRFCSLHQWPLYPGSGQDHVGNCRNIPLPEGTGEADYLKSFEPALEDLLAFKPELIAVSAGFDAYKDDPIAGLKLDAKTFRRIGRLIAGSGLRRFAVLEGGYSEQLPILIEEFLNGFA